jgi:hypothetical protein
MTRTTSSTKSRAVPPPEKTKQYEIHPARPQNSSPGFLGSMVQGFGLGMGSSMGHRATDAMLGEKKTEQLHTNPVVVCQGFPESCDQLLQKYRDCMSSDFLHCDQNYDEYLVCIQPK